MRLFTSLMGLIFIVSCHTTPKPFFDEKGAAHVTLTLIADRNNGNPHPMDERYEYNAQLTKDSVIWQVNYFIVDLQKPNGQERYSMAKQDILWDHVVINKMPSRHEESRDAVYVELFAKDSSFMVSYPSGTKRRTNAFTFGAYSEEAAESAIAAMRKE